MAAATSVWEKLGLTDSEYEKIQQILGRTPNYLELALFSVMWSEHCGYKHSRALLSRFPTEGKHVLQGPGENAGIIDIGDGQAIVMKIESHNHPSAIEPYQGAATGVGGILRDIFTMGARPIANLNSLRFGPLTAPRQRYLLNGVVAGIAGYGNCTGIPTVAGEVYFDECYEGNCLVNAMSVGLLEKDQPIARGIAAGVGNPVMVVGSRTGRDGIHGATFASEELNEESEEKRPSVQVGDPFTEKLLIEACLEAIRSGYLVGIQDMGAAGLTSSACEMAARGKHGIEMDIALVPRREEGMTPYEVMLSESQERMLLVPKQGHVDDIRTIFEKWGLQAVVVGYVTDDGMLRIKDGGEVVAEVPAAALAHAPVYHPPTRRPAYLEETATFDVSSLPEPEDLGKTLLQLLASPNIASKEWVFQQYDYMVQTNTVVGPGSDAAVLRIKGTRKAIALTVDGNGRFCYLDPYEGGAAAVAEAARNLVCSGAQPLAITDCLNFGNPEKPEIYWQFAQTIEGMAKACRKFDTPVISGNVSFYNETKGKAIYPTPVVGMVGLIDDVDRVCTQGFKQAGDIIVLVGENRNELGGSEYLKVVHNLVTGQPPHLNLDEEKRVQDFCLAAIQSGVIHSAHDCSEGGLAVALAECCISGKIGADIYLLENGSPAALLFGESHSRIILSLAEKDLPPLQRLAIRMNVPLAVLGVVTGDHLRIQIGEEKTKTAPKTALDLSVAQLEKTWREAIPCLMQS